ncbi:unnamed protein product [Penicillium salamii]|nr:unnamed protein product [Penicillium salamii]CAG8222797.1 unnamed protein product [Penicillium salamii]
MRFRLMLSLSSLLLCTSPAAATQEDLSQYVSPFIGSEGPEAGTAFGGGDIFVGGALPFGVAKVGLDTTAANWTTATLNGGWTPDGNVTGISMMHESGTGGSPKYGIISQMPLTSVDQPVNVLDNLTYSQPRVGKDTARVGYFKTQLENGITVELSASRHAGIMEYSFPEGEKHVLIDVIYLRHLVMPIVRPLLEARFRLKPMAKLIAVMVHMLGVGTTVCHPLLCSPHLNVKLGAPFTVYFYGELSDNPQNSQTFSGANTDPMPRSQNLANGGTSKPKFANTSKVTSGTMNDRIGLLFSWNSGPASHIVSRVGISTISVDRAHSYIREEIPSWTLNDTVTSAVKEWNEDVFNKIQVPLDSSSNMTHVRLLYSSLYFMHLMPSDRTGENPLWDSGEPYWDDFYTMWDIFRCTVSFYHIFRPKYYESMIRGLIDIWKHSGYMPDGRSGNWNGLVQGGSDADNVLADAYVKGLRGAINWTEGYAAMKKDAEVTPYNTFDPTDFSASTKEGRGALDDWKELGYVSQDRNTRCISRTVEYSLNDFAVSQVAAGEMPSDQEKYLNRSAGWQNIWNADVKSLGFSGFMAPRFSNGSFNNSGYDPLYCYGCEWEDYTYEGTPWGECGLFKNDMKKILTFLEYSFVIPHDVKSLIEFMGGEKTFESRLDLMFKPNMSVQDLGANGAGISTLMNIGFKDTAYGIPGNSDAGAMNSWLLWQIIGVYPIVTQPVYLLSSPWFPDLNMTINGDKTLRITANNLDDGYYVQSLKINGKRWTKNWFEHDDVMTNGGTIEFELGAEAKAWETGEVPPSPGHVQLNRDG